ncbi:uncharacterized protein LOC124459722 [Drosophila willistoni]|uniref:uncharacterized protein LOC124459722 n=1 Tax=Drosophila willistoni TaxID=7260 RepID=UPI001F077CBA|nr:uncharacterized protein LOC124459722 [Drosophila willistoni]
MKHQNVNATITEIRMKFWITKARRVLQRVIWICGVCKLQRATPTPPLMGPLPEDCLMPGGWLFEYTGLDYFGPLLVTGRRQEKRWVALFTCLRTRAIHLELAHDLSTDSCILAMRNFMCRRAPVTKLRSDNGKNFFGADREAKRFTDIFEADKIQDELATRCVEWIFNCPLNPTEGGVWERMVQCVKRVLAHTVKEVAPKEHVLQSLLIEAENIVNSRPLTHLPDTPTECQELPKPCETRKQWRMARLLRDRFWKRWDHEYLPTLVRREKSCARTQPISKDDVVYICDPATLRREWSKGILEEVYTGADGIPRRAAVRVADGNRVHRVVRPVSRLAVLDVMQSLHGCGDVAGRELITE